MDLRQHWTLDPAIRFLNHGSFGACPRPVLERQRELRAELEREPVLFMARQLEARVDEARAALAPHVGASADDLVPVTNATTGVNAVLRSLAFEPGDEIVVTDHGYNACRNAAEFVAERRGLRVVVARVPFPLRSPDEVVEAVLAVLGPRTRLALLDHITSPTGLVFPIRTLVHALRERGIDTLVDGAHAPGMVSLDLDALGAAYFTGNLHKWLCAPKGAGFLHVRRDRQSAVRPVVISHGANSQRRDRSRFQLEFDFTGTDDPTAFLCVPECLRFLGGLFPGGLEEVRARNRALVLAGRAELLRVLGGPAPAPDGMIGSLVALPLPLGRGPTPTDVFSGDALQRVLFERHHIEVPVFTWPAAPHRLLRISAQAYNAPEEYAALATALERELAAAV